MQINSTKFLIGFAVIQQLVGCTPYLQDDDLYGAGFIEVDQTAWQEKYSKPYPFTVTSGEILCDLHPEFGREVYFTPKGFTDESYISTPLNKAARKSLEQAKIEPNVPYSVKKGADLSEVIKIGLQVCDEREDMLKSNR